MAGDGEKAAAATGSNRLHSKTLLKSEQLYQINRKPDPLIPDRLTGSPIPRQRFPCRVQYVLESTVFPREPDCLRELRVATAAHPMARMAASPDQVQLFGMLIGMLGARNAIEVGVFTGYSLLATALALPDDGKVVAIDVSRESYDKVGSPVVEKAGMAHKVDFRVGLALPVLDQLVAEDGNLGKFDFAFVNADKANFHHYHERLLRLVRVGGLIAYDNTLWGGSVSSPDDKALSEQDRELAGIARGFNATLTGDRRVQVCQIAISDEIMLCHRVA